jgi:hypothetical protein
LVIEQADRALNKLTHSLQIDFCNLTLYKTFELQKTPLLINYRFGLDKYLVSACRGAEWHKSLSKGVNASTIIGSPCGTSPAQTVLTLPRSQADASKLDTVVIKTKVNDIAFFLIFHLVLRKFD